jgi:hypothetical protein
VRTTTAALPKAGGPLNRAVCNALLVAAAVALVAASAAAEPTRVVGTTVSLQPPDGFVASTQFPGFQQTAAAASIVVTEMPAPAAEVSAGFTKAGLAKRGVNLVGSEPVTVSGRDAQLMRVTQMVDGKQFQKWIVLLGDGARSVLITASYPTSAKALREPLKQAVLSAIWSPDLAVGPFDGLSFRISEGERLKLAGRAGNMLLLTENGAKPPVAAGAPFAIAGASVGDAAAGNVEAFARARIMQINTLADVTNLKGDARPIDGLSAYELTGDAVDSKTGTPIAIYQLIIADQRQYFIVQGLVARPRGAELLPQFRAIGESLRRQ